MTPDPNLYFWIVLLGITSLFALNLLSNLLNLRALDPELPTEFSDTYDGEKYARSQQYARATTRFGLLESAFFLAIFLLFWLLGGYGWLDGFVRSLALGPTATGLCAISLILAAHHLLSLPFDLYDTFVIEERFGFNKTTLRTWFGDELKSLLLTAVIGLPLLALLLTLFDRFTLAWLYGWIAVSGFTLLLTYLAPRYILPLFNKFTPLQDEALLSAIQRMAQKCDFPITEISVMDGSKRSTKSNAFFTGFGRNKKIALFDTMIEKHTSEELVAVLAHEIGHFKKKHIVQRMLFGVFQTGALFYLLNLFLESPALFTAFGVAQPSTYLGFVFFGILFKPLSKIISILLSIWSRKHEYEADAFAADATGDAPSLIDALKKLAGENLANLTPHPFHVFMLYSHPPLLQRIAALRALPC